MPKVFGVLILCGSGLLLCQEPSAHYRTSVSEVALDLVVRDNRGRQVKDLKPEEVAIYEDGVRQQIKSFRLAPGREVRQQQAGAAQEGKKATPARLAGAANPLPAVNLICIVFHNIDVLDPTMMKFVQESVERFLDRELQPGTGVAFFSLGSHLTVLHEFTTDRKELMRALANSFRGPIPNYTSIADAVLNAAPYQAQVAVGAKGDLTVSIAGGRVSPRAITGADVGTSQGEQILRGLQADHRRAFGRIQGMEHWDQMKLLLTELGPLPGRKTVLLFSTGLATTGEPDLFQKLLDWANRGQTTVYALDVNGLTMNSTALASSLDLEHAASVSRGQATPISGGNVGASMENSRQGDYTWMAVRTSDTQASLRHLSEGTGGFLIANTEDLRKPFQRVLEDVDTHYEAVYRPTSDKYDGRLRTIEVKLARANLNVQSRTGYFALPALEGSGPVTLPEMIGLAALNAPERPHVFDFQSAAYEFRPTAAGSHCVLAFEVPAERLTARALPDHKRHRVHISLLALVKDSGGQVVDKFSQDAGFDIPDGQLEATRKSSIPFTHALELPAGRYTLETAVYDREADLVSVGKTEFESPEAKGVSLSSVMLVHELQTFNGKADASDPLQFPVSATQGRRVLPALSMTLGAAAEPFVYFVVYPDPGNPEKPKLEVEVTTGGQVIEKQTAELRPRATGFIPMVVKVPPHAGECEFKVTARQGSASATRILAYTIAAK